jgi:hypothetical protein
VLKLVTPAVALRHLRREGGLARYDEARRLSALQSDPALGSMHNIDACFSAERQAESLRQLGAPTSLLTPILTQNKL